MDEFRRMNDLVRKMASWKQSTVALNIYSTYMHDDGTMVEDVASLRGSSVAPFVVSLSGTGLSKKS